MNQSVAAKKELSSLTSSEREAVQEFARFLRERFGRMVREIILFGSRARGQGDRESDIDILIVMTNLSWEIKRTISELAAVENMKHGVLISTVRYNSATWENPVIKASPFGTAVREQGIWL